MRADISSLSGPIFKVKYKNDQLCSLNQAPSNGRVSRSVPVKAIMARLGTTVLVLDYNKLYSDVKAKNLHMNFAC